MASVLWRSTSDDWLFLPIFIVVTIAGFAAPYWRIFVQRRNGIRGAEWGLFPAVIDVVSVVAQTQDSRYGTRVIYLATLTYFYRNPDLQMGEYCRMFDDESEAKVWADSFKGRDVMVHVDPKDPSRSVLREEELNSVTLSMRPIS